MPADAVISVSNLHESSIDQPRASLTAGMTSDCGTHVAIHLQTQGPGPFSPSTRVKRPAFAHRQRRMEIK
ncbi:hypothetical protein GQ44DRAFT_706011 [Phaeosphaeriaceae sp. PMI808]|nr:hypothetical protein GQ44DRAFT_706011 [Phaeosphaeriaceae sp. PMI808]